MTSKTYCHHIQKGLFVSHRGIAHCCTNTNKHKTISPKEFWFGEQRQSDIDKMNNGEKIQGCEKCYKFEEEKQHSPRHVYMNYKDTPAKKLPTILDLDLSNLCNLKCIMCSADRSSMWAKAEGKGVSSVDTKMLDELIDMSDDLLEITIEGGEPSIMKDFDYYFLALKKKGIIQNINLMIITNLTNISENFLNLMNDFKTVSLGISLDAFDKANQYIRWPSRWHTIENNMKKVSKIVRVKEIYIMNTLNPLSMYNFGNFIQWVSKQQKVFQKNFTFGARTNCTNSPSYYNPMIVPNKLKQKFIKDVKNNLHLVKIQTWKIELQILLKRLQESQENTLEMQKFKEKIQQLDKERGVKVEDFIPDYYEYI